MQLVRKIQKAADAFPADEIVKQTALVKKTILFNGHGNVMSKLYVYATTILGLDCNNARKAGAV